jgi:hypothetical protein
MASSFDTNANNYTISELLIILDLDDPTSSEIIDATNKYIERFDSEGNAKMVKFFTDVQTKLVEYVDNLEEGGDPDELEFFNDDEQANEWYKNEVLTQKNNPIQKDKITERKQKIDVFEGGNQMPMNREQLGVNNTFDLPVAQDTLNPNLKNVTSRFVNLDSQFRQASDTSSTDYTLDLSDPLTNALSLRMYSVQIPYTWYLIDNQYGNTCFWIVIPYNDVDYEVQVSFTPGNYNYESFKAEFAKAIKAAKIKAPDPAPPDFPSLITINTSNSLVTINLNGWIYTYTDPNPPHVQTLITINGIKFNDPTDTFDPLLNPYFVFFDFSGRLNCLTNCSSKNPTINGTLGWLMGFRLPIVPIYLAPGNTPIAIIDLYGPKYFILVLDDFNQNHINNGLITITEISKKLAMPSYFNTSQPYICVSNSSNPLTNLLNNATTAESIATGLTTDNAFGLLDKINIGYGQRQVILPSAPRTLTNAQLYTINEITKNREQNTTFRGKAPTNSDTFALIPIKKGGMSTGDLYVEFGGSMQDNKRIYFGPVSVDRMRIKLVDDRGYTVDLHGAEWCFTIIAELLYQY